MPIVGSLISVASSFAASLGTAEAMYGVWKAPETLSIFAVLAPIVGATWVLHEDLTTIGFRAPAGVRNATMAAAILAQLQIDAKSSMRVHPDTGQLYMDPNGELEKGKADWMVNDPFWGNPYWNGAREELAATAARATTFPSTPIKLLCKFPVFNQCVDSVSDATRAVITPFLNSSRKHQVSLRKA